MRGAATLPRYKDRLACFMDTLERCKTLTRTRAMGHLESICAFTFPSNMQGQVPITQNYRLDTGLFASQ